MKIDEKDYLAHYGILRKSGRYPWGSGETPFERSNTFVSMVADLRKQGFTSTEIARAFSSPEHPFTTTDLRNTTTIARAQKSAADQATAIRLKYDKGMSNIAIGKQMGRNESSVRALLAAAEKDKVDVLQTTANMLKDEVGKKKFLDVGTGTEIGLGISSTKLGTALSMLKDEGYEVHSVKLPQVGTVHKTEYKVLCPPGTTQKEAWQNRYNIKIVTNYSEDGGRSYLGVKPPLSINSKRVGVTYGEDGGSHADGVIYVRPGVKDVSLGKARYAQVRIAVDDTHFLKGMAMYKDDLPPGVDLMFNTKKSNTGNKLDAMKTLKDEPDNPFGSTIRQITDPHTGKLTSVMNIVGSPSKEGSGEEGSWDTWSRNLSSQFLSKQSPSLAKQQLDVTYENKKADLEEIMHLTNPAVKRQLLQSFADETDTSAWHLKAAQLPRQSTHVILPMNSIKETEIYAPNFDNGERVVLIRHPHGGVFEIPELTVNNNHPEGKRLLGEQAKDAVGIHHKVAEKLSGADFDGDTVIVIPNKSGKIRTAPSLEGLKGFDPQRTYAPYDGMRTIDGGTYNAKTKQVEYHNKPPSSRAKQTAMGDISNLITDMTIKKASSPEIAAAVRHSMVVIDAEKHHLNYKQSYQDNGIANLKVKYQGRKDAGASTLISLKKHEDTVLERKPGPRIDPTTGKLIYRHTNATTLDKQGNVVPKMQKVKTILEIDDVNKLSSGTKIEKIYADHANRLKDLSTEARKALVNTRSQSYSPSARKAYDSEVKSLEAKLNVALKNRPLERQAQVIANRTLAMKREAKPSMDKEEEKKIKYQALVEARTRTGAGKQAVDITDNEWHAIQAGAITNNKLTEILKNANMDRVKELATPRNTKLMTSTKLGRAQSLLSSGYTQAQVAEQLGVSLSTLKRSLGGG